MIAYNLIGASIREFAARCDDFSLEFLNAVEHNQPQSSAAACGYEAVMAFTTSNGRTQTALADINITPLVDVVLVLLIIFMVTAPVLQSGIDVAVPKTKTVKEITEERTGHLDQQGSARLSGKRPDQHQRDWEPVAAEDSRSAASVDFCAGRRERPFRRLCHGDGRGEAGGFANVSIVTQPMDTNAASAEIFFEHDRWGRALAWSAGLHVGITAALIVYASSLIGEAVIHGERVVAVRPLAPPW